MLQSNCKLKIMKNEKDDENNDENLKAQLCWIETDDEMLPVFKQFLWS